jgi:hypothetical protein
MVPKKYTDLGFEITKFGANSKALRFGQKPIFVFNARTNLDSAFLIRLCDIYQKLNAKKESLICAGKVD